MANNLGVVSFMRYLLPVPPAVLSHGAPQQVVLRARKVRGEKRGREDRDRETETEKRQRRRRRKVGWGSLRGSCGAAGGGTCSGSQEYDIFGDTMSSGSFRCDDVFSAATQPLWHY
jgi:hypothetical protein